MTVLFLDEFNGSGALADHTADTGELWTGSGLTLDSGVVSGGGSGELSLDMTLFSDFEVTMNVTLSDDMFINGGDLYRATLSVEGESPTTNGGGTFLQVTASRDEFAVPTYEVSLRTANTGSGNPVISSIFFDGTLGDHVLSVLSTGGILSYSFDGALVGATAIGPPYVLTISLFLHFSGGHLAAAVCDTLRIDSYLPIVSYFWTDKIECSEAE